MSTKTITRNDLSTDGSGRRFRKANLERWRRYLIDRLRLSRRRRDEMTADSFERQTIHQFANHGGYVIVD